jgi:hypothetical protein
MSRVSRRTISNDYDYGVQRFVGTFAIDCEMVGVGYRGNVDMLARVTIVDHNGSICVE